MGITDGGIPVETTSREKPGAHPYYPTATRKLEGLENIAEEEKRLDRVGRALQQERIKIERDRADLRAVVDQGKRKRRAQQEERKLNELLDGWLAGGAEEAEDIEARQKDGYAKRRRGRS